MEKKISGVEENSTGGQGSRRAVAPSDDDYNDTPRSVGLLWTSDQPVAETST